MNYSLLLLSTALAPGGVAHGCGDVYAHRCETLLMTAIETEDLDTALSLMSRASDSFFRNPETMSHSARKRLAFVCSVLMETKSWEVQVEILWWFWYELYDRDGRAALGAIRQLKKDAPAIDAGADPNKQSLIGPVRGVEAYVDGVLKRFSSVRPTVEISRKSATAGKK